ncbi:hypothetical protein Moror_14557 [Moniliophthora roreri MCA 2997]|uniref:Uncharacterized protein n=1 Tax=Moniliophthora roreri (strain MCA 2997) TaxID=1381753 RepID=V2YNN5_MONRO|nr:hypothetical protein Moror_14557 [Moniliophthora roreri MCA 2997]
MSAYHLRPVSPVSVSEDRERERERERETRTRDRELRDSRMSPTHPHRRPLSPTSIRDVDLTHTPHNSKYPAPPTGHELMAMFPPSCNIPVRPEPTSGYFQVQERQFFAQAGKEIVRVRVEIDLPPEDKGLRRDRRGVTPYESPPYNHHTVSVSPSQAARRPHPHHHSQPPPTLHTPTPHSGGPLRITTTSPSSPVPLGPNGSAQTAEDDDDESWRRPMPPAERRRAGKHTRRVVVRN